MVKADGGALPLLGLQPLLSAEEVPDHDHGGGHELGEGDGEGGGAEGGGAGEHDQLIDAQAHDGERDEDDELTPAAHVVAALEDVLHGREVVEDHAHAERDGGGKDRVPSEPLREEHEDAVVDAEGDGADDAELEELFNELAHGELGLSGVRCVL